MAAHANSLCPENPMARGTLAGYGPWGYKEESDTTERPNTLLEQRDLFLLILLLVACL